MLDENIETFLLLLLTVIIVLLNGFFVATEFALVKVRSTRIKELSDSGNAAAKLVSRALARLDAYLSAAQVGITLASLGLGWIGEPVILERIVIPIFARLGWHGGTHTSTLEGAVAFALAFTLITFAHIVFGEQAPKALAIQRAESTALWIIRPMTAFFWLFKPFIIVLNSAANATLRLLRIEPASIHDLVHSEEELRMIITASADENGGTLRETQAELLDNVFDFGHRLARQVMTHRTEVLVLDVENALAENVHLAQEGGHSRFPVIQGDIDTVIGFVHTKDLYALFQRDPQGDIREIMREILLVPESIRVDVLLRQLQRRRQQLAVLVDEYGGTAGLVTLMDLLEELVGEMPDEFEPAEEDWLIHLEANTWSVDGRLSLEDLEEALHRELDCDEACDTVGGYAFWAFGRIPEAGDVLRREAITLRVLAMDGRRVSRLQVTAEHSEAEDEEADAVAGRGRP